MKLFLFSIFILIPYIIIASEKDNYRLSWLDSWKSATVMLGEVEITDSTVGKVGLIAGEPDTLIVFQYKIFQPLATGFLVWNYVKGEGEGIPFLVTARHVFESNGKSLSSIKMRFPHEKNVPLSQDTGCTLQLLSTKGIPLWRGHPKHTKEFPKDIAAISILYCNGTIAEKITAIPYSRFMLTDSISESDMVLSLGYPGNVGYLGEIYRTHPILRGGVISWISFSQRSTAIPFLIDVPSYPGNSGGPVFIAPSVFSELNQPYCVGIVSSFVPELSVAKDSRGIMVNRIGQNSGLTEVIPAEWIIETLAQFGNPASLKKTNTQNKSKK